MAAWLASFTRLGLLARALGFQPLALGGHGTFAAFAHLREADRAGQARAASDSTNSSTTVPAPRPVRADSLSCRSPSAARSGSLSARMAACASRAATRPCRLPRMAPACVRVCS